jgi:hypothetical protein
LSLVQAEIENPKFGVLEMRCLTIVVFPEPDGAEKIIAFPDDMKWAVLFYLLDFLADMVAAIHWVPAAWNIWSSALP